MRMPGIYSRGRWRRGRDSPVFVHRQHARCHRTQRRCQTAPLHAPIFRLSHGRREQEMSRSRRLTLPHFAASVRHHGHERRIGRKLRRVATLAANRGRGGRGVRIERERVVPMPCPTRDRRRSLQSLRRSSLPRLHPLPGLSVRAPPASQESKLT
jgi:hypothetical protein